MSTCILYTYVYTYIPVSTCVHRNTYTYPLIHKEINAVREKL